jgi:tRNA pseudouridine13 synthase
MSEQVLQPDSQLAYPLTCEYAYGGPQVTGLLRASPANFQVNEVLGFVPCGEGEHDFLQLRKTGINSAQLAQQIAELAGVKPMDVGYAGLKDRHAVTSQWFSVYRPKGAAVDWYQLEKNNEKGKQVELLTVSRHHQKLRRGQHAANRFRLRITRCAGDLDNLKRHFEQIESSGVPNYFGPQRFGFGGGNLFSAQRLLVDKRPVRNRQLRGLYLSAARSYLFNQVLRARIKDASWQTFEEGDVASDLPSEQSLPTGPLWGRGRLATRQRIGDLEAAVVDGFSDWCHGLEHAGLKQDRRSLCLPVSELNWSVSPDTDNSVIEVAFSLPVGGYATSMIREIVDYREPERHHASGSK